MRICDLNLQNLPAGCKNKIKKKKKKERKKDRKKRKTERKKKRKKEKRKERKRKKERKKKKKKKMFTSCKQVSDQMSLQNGKQVAWWFFPNAVHH